jgi:hypothetical protein
VQNWCKVGAKGGADLVQEVVKEMVRWGGDGAELVQGWCKRWCRSGARGW